MFYFFIVFSKKGCIFQENNEKPSLGAKFLLKKRGRLTTKKNITVFIENKVLNNLSSDHFFEESNIFRENSQKISGVGSASEE